MISGTVSLYFSIVHYAFRVEDQTSYSICLWWSVSLPCPVYLSACILAFFSAHPRQVCPPLLQPSWSRAGPEGKRWREHPLLTAPTQRKSGHPVWRGDLQVSIQQKIWNHLTKQRNEKCSSCAIQHHTVETSPLLNCFDIAWTLKQSWKGIYCRTVIWDCFSFR